MQQRRVSTRRITLMLLRFFKCSIIDVHHGKRRTSGGRDDEENSHEQQRRRFKNNTISFVVFHTDGRKFNNIKYY